MNKRGFTLSELLVTLVIIALIAGIGVMSFNLIFGTSEERYYTALESSIRLAGNDYFLDHRDLLPTGDKVSSVTIAQLVSEKYLEQPKTSTGYICNDGKVFVYKENNKYRYEACIECDAKHVSTGRYCSSNNS